MIQQKLHNLKLALNCCWNGIQCKAINWEFRAICKGEKSDFLAPISRYFEATGVCEVNKTTHTSKQDEGGPVETELKQIFFGWWLRWTDSIPMPFLSPTIISATNITYFNFVICFVTFIFSFRVEQNNFI